MSLKNDLSMARIFRGLTQEQLSKKANVSIRTISKLENDIEDENIKYVNKSKLANALGFNTKDLFDNKK